MEELNAIEREMSTLPRRYDPHFRAILPLNLLHERLFRTQARLWRAMNAAPLVVWQTGLWDPLPLTQAPLRPSRPAVKVAMMLNEYRAGAFNISNAGDRPVSVQLKIIGLPGGDNPPYITVHEVAWTDTKRGMPVAAALPRAKRNGKGFVIHVPSGMTRQVWLTFHPVKVVPGSHRGHIVLTTGQTTQAVPLTLRLFPMRFPDRPTLHLGGWDYTDLDAVYDITRQNQSQVLAHLREHFVDSPWATAAVLTPVQYDAEGNMIAKPNTFHFDRWLSRWPHARQYCVFAAVGNRFADSLMGTPEFEKKVGIWISFWAAHMRQKGLKPGQLNILLVDEPSEPQQDRIILAWARAIRDANTGVKIWEDPLHADPAAADQEMMESCDVLCPNRVLFLTSNESYRAFYVTRHRKGTELAFYSCSGPVRLLDPYSYHRLQAWSCWQYGAKSSYFWAFSDSGGGSSWNEYAARGTAFVPFFLDAASVTPGKHMEALREGAEDYEYLVMLQKEVVAAKKRGVAGQALDHARKLLAKAPDRVCNAPGANTFEWAPKKDRTLADRVRVEVLEAIAALSKVALKSLTARDATANHLASWRSDVTSASICHADTGRWARLFPASNLP